jgi:hypothetical protein
MDLALKEKYEMKSKLGQAFVEKFKFKSMVKD